MAGLRYGGEWALIMDDDFQPPEEGLKLVNFALNNNYTLFMVIMKLNGIHLEFCKQNQ